MDETIEHQTVDQEKTRPMEAWELNRMHAEQGWTLLAVNEWNRAGNAILRYTFARKVRR